jgi:redox-regulated HSP33 family molecular chaperone
VNSLHLDQALGIIIPGRHARGRIVRLGPVMEEILSAHGYPPVIEALMAEALVVTALLGAMLKDAGGQLTMQAQTEAGPVSLLVCDYKGGELRGYVKHEAERIAALPKNPTLDQIFGKGYLAITFDQETSGERYQGIVPLEGASLSRAISSSPSKFPASSGWRWKGILPAGCCSSIWPRAKRGANGSIHGWITPNGSMSRSWGTASARPN